LTKEKFQLCVDNLHTPALLSANKKSLKNGTKRPHGTDT